MHNNSGDICPRATSFGSCGDRSTPLKVVYDVAAITLLDILGFDSEGQT